MVPSEAYYQLVTATAKPPSTTELIQNALLKSFKGIQNKCSMHIPTCKSSCIILIPDANNPRKNTISAAVKDHKWLFKSTWNISQNKSIQKLYRTKIET